MTTVIKYLLICVVMLCSCNKDDAPNPLKVCANDPLQEIQWLQKRIQNETTSANSSGLEIIQYQYQNSLAFSINDCTNNCSDALTRIFDCEQNLICEKGGISGIDTCADFFKEAKNSVILFSSKNSSSFNCDKSLIQSESLYNASKTTTINKAEIIENCLHLTFSILSTQDRIGDVNLIDSGQILESFPIQRKLKLVVTENLTKPISVEVTTSFDLSILMSWDDPNPIVLDIDGYDKALTYKRVPQCGDPNVNCVSQDQLKERKDLDTQLEKLKTIANAVPCVNTDDWKITPIGSKACGGPASFMAYSNTIEVTDFLTKIENLKKAEDAYNRKWGIISNCALVTKPSGVVCEEGKAIFVQ